MPLYRSFRVSLEASCLRHPVLRHPLGVCGLAHTVCELASRPRDSGMYGRVAQGTPQLEMAHHVEKAQGRRFVRLYPQPGAGQFFVLVVFQVAPMCEPLFQRDEPSGEVPMQVRATQRPHSEVHGAQECDRGGKTNREPTPPFRHIGQVNQESRHCGRSSHHRRRYRYRVPDLVKATSVVVVTNGPSNPEEKIIGPFVKLFRHSSPSCPRKAQGVWSAARASTCPRRWTWKQPVASVLSFQIPKASVMCHPCYPVPLIDSSLLVTRARQRPVAGKSYRTLDAKAK